MNELLIKTYSIDALPLEVSFRPKVISIDFRPYTQKQQLNLLYEHSGGLINEIMHDYQQHYGHPLKISKRSLMAEIWGHLLAYRISLGLKKHLKVWPVQKLAKFAAFRSAIIDCGEAKVDTNRWFWDATAWAFFRKYR
ncbi:hypothetical protein [Pedobacter sp.]|uniref:hypothetical protein n=1 Tax=Pedobacter sp. TaxID=1411316 RepID=UPI0031D78167